MHALVTWAVNFSKVVIAFAAAKSMQKEMDRMPSAKDKAVTKERSEVLRALRIQASNMK